MDGPVDWSLAEEHMWRRHRVLLAWAQEAWADPDALTVDPDPSSRSGHALRVIGHSPSARAVLVVIVVRHAGRLYAASAWPANHSHARRYEEERARDDRS